MDVDYSPLTDAELCALCIWREARGEGYLGKRGVMHTIWNRAQQPGWWGHNPRQVVLKPFQFSSFNAKDPNSRKWEKTLVDRLIARGCTLPDGFIVEYDAQNWQDSENIANAVLARDQAEQNDLTNGAVYYFSPPLKQAPPAWGAVVVTITMGNLTFCKQAPADLGTDGGELA